MRPSSWPLCQAGSCAHLLWDTQNKINGQVRWDGAGWYWKSHEAGNCWAVAE